LKKIVGMDKITSIQNPSIKNIVKLKVKSTERKQQKLFIIEGAKEIGLALSAGFVIESVYCYLPLVKKDFINFVLKQSSGRVKLIEINKEIFEKIATRDSSDGLLAVAQQRNDCLDVIKLSKNPLIIILETVEKPGNLGAVLRTADAANADAVIICEPNTDFYNPNTIRSSLGCVFTNQIAACTITEVIDWLKKNNIVSYAAALSGTTYYHKTNFKHPSAIVMGTEAHGLSKDWLTYADKIIKIPMMGQIDSLNVSAATAIILFEAKRQRDFM